MKKAELKELSGTEVTEISGCPVVSYHELIQYFDLEEILQDRPGFTILYENEYNDGHYCAVLIQPDGIEFFDSYGFNKNIGQGSSRELNLHDIDSELHFSKYDENLVKNKSQFDPKHTLKHLIHDYASRHSLKIIINHHQFQTLDDSINTCGRWTGYRIRRHNLTLPEFIKLRLNDEDIVTITNRFLS